MEFQVRTGTPWHTHHETYETVTDSIIWQKWRWIDDPALVIGEAWTACWASLRLSQGGALNGRDARSQRLGPSTSGNSFGKTPSFANGQIGKP